MAWPTDWDDRLSGASCPMCAEGRPAETAHGVRVFEGRYLDAYVAKQGAQRGYVVAIWRGRHVTDLADLAPDELVGYWAEVARVAGALRDHYRPRKMNYEVLGNQVPHLHTHLTARFAEGDVAPGGPLPPERNVDLPAEIVNADSATLRALLNDDS